MTLPSPDPIPGPYAHAAEEWRDAGWNPLPLPPRAKAPPPDGYTGREGKDPDAQQVAAWISERPDANIGLRMPVGVVGIDVDAYKEVGATSWNELVLRNGPLPVSWLITSRNDGTSGIRLYRVPAGVELRGVAAPGIEILQHHHRYAVTWPSIHPSGELYRLIGPDGADDCPFPAPSELPELPPKWIEALMEVPREPGEAKVREHTGEWSHAVQAAFAEGMAGMVKGSRHDVARDCCLALVRLEELGHPGADEAIMALRRWFVEAIQDRCTEAEACKEWADLVAGAWTLVASTASMRPSWDELEHDGGQWDPWEMIGQTRPVAESPPEEAPGHGWEPADLGLVLEPGYEAPSPTLGLRNDGVGLFYAGRVNGIIGESGSGKSWLALCAVAQELSAGRPVLYIDLEDHVASLVQRLFDLGVERDAVVAGLVYVQPDLAYGASAAVALEQIVSARGVGLVVVDSVGEAMALQAMKQNDDDEVTRWFRLLPRRLAALGPAVVLVDHVPKAKDAPAGYAIGSQRKRAAIDGHSMSTEQVKALGRGKAGVVKVTTAKDRNGAHPTGFVVAELHLDSTAASIVWALKEPPAASLTAEGEFRPTFLMERVSRCLELNPGLSGNQVEQAVKGNNTTIRDALKVLVAERHLEATPRGQGPKAGISYAVLKPFREMDEIVEPVDNS